MSGANQLAGNRARQRVMLKAFATNRILILFVLFLLANTAYLDRVPGLMGDEASEGDNVYHLLLNDRITVVGERSYVGPLVDYARTPFILAFGYSALTLRLLMLVISIATFCLAYIVWRRLFGDYAAEMITAVVFFSPIYLLYQRLGWAITLFPLLALLLLVLLTDRRLSIPARSSLAGLVAGLGLHNYVVFLPTLAGVGVPWLTQFLKRPRELLRWWYAIIGFWAGFGTQFAVLQLVTEDQGSPGEVMSLFWQRVGDLPGVLPLVLSGSAYMARYTGEALSGAMIGLIVLALVIGAGIALLIAKRRTIAWLWLLGLTIQLLSLMLIVDRYTLRYFTIFVLGFWVLTGVGLAFVTQKVKFAPVVVALLLLTWTGFSVLQPYLQQGGSTDRFSLGNRTDSAADFVDIERLVKCVEQSGPVWSDNPHINNRLLFLSRGNDLIDLPLDINEAHWVIDYRLPGEVAGVQCAELKHFRLEKRR